jgi:hypothetical protein
MTSIGRGPINTTHSVSMAINRASHDVQVIS